MHLCTETPCPQQDKECSDILKNGFTASYIKRNKMKPNNKHLLSQIDDLVNTDFCNDMEFKIYSEKPYTQHEAQQMAKLLALVYGLSHQLHRKACRGRTNKNV